MASTDGVLVDQIARGDGAAMATLQDRHADMLFRFALSRLHDRDEALDALQETFIAIWDAAGSFRGDSRLETWMLGICRNKIGERFRRRRASTQPIAAAEAIAAAGSVETSAEFWHALRQLDEADQELILLVFHQGLSQHEVADMLGIPVGTVKSRTYHARRKLRKQLQGGD